MKDSKGVDVELIVSTGIQMLQMPDVVNKEYRDAQMTLQKTGFVVEFEFVKSDSVTENYVISTNPEAGDSIPAGATVYMTVSAGPDVATVQMPNLKGLSRAVAIARIEQANGARLAVSTETPAAPYIEIRYVHDDSLSTCGYRWSVDDGGLRVECSDGYKQSSANCAVGAVALLW